MEFFSELFQFPAGSARMAFIQFVVGVVILCITGFFAQKWAKQGLFDKRPPEPYVKDRNTYNYMWAELYLDGREGPALKIGNPYFWPKDDCSIHIGSKEESGDHYFFLGDNDYLLGTCKLDRRDEVNMKWENPERLRVWSRGKVVVDQILAAIEVSSDPFVTITGYDEKGGDFFLMPGRAITVTRGPAVRKSLFGVIEE